MLVDIVDQPLSVFAHFKEVGLFLSRMDFPAAVRAFAVHELAFRPKAFAGGAVQALISALVDVPFVVKVLENFLDFPFVVVIGGADEVVIGDVHQVKLFLDDAGHPVHKLFGGNAFGFCLQLVFLAVLVGAGLEENIVPFQTFEAGNTVRQHNLIHVADMGLAGRVGDGRSEIILSLVAHDRPSIPLNRRLNTEIKGTWKRGWRFSGRSIRKTP